MENRRHWKPLSRKARQQRPRHPFPLTATANHSQAAFAYLDAKAPETGEITGDRVIVEVTLNHAPQPFPDLCQRLMHSPPKRALHLFQLGQEALSDGFARHEELAVLLGLSTNMRNT